MQVPALAAEPSVTPVALIGLGDAVQAQWQGPVSVELAGSAGHLAVIGAPRTGRTCALRTVALSLAATAAPSRLHLYAISAAAELATLSALAHTGAVAHPANADLVLDVIGTVTALLASRQRASTGGVRQLHRPADIILLIDDWPSLRAALPDLEPLVQDIAAAGLAVGIHLVLSGHRWSDLRAALRDCVGSRIELHVPDPLESLIPRGIPGPPADQPGRGMLLSGRLSATAPDTPLPMPVQLAFLAPDADEAVRRRWASHPAPVPRIFPLPPIAVRPSGLTPQLALGVGSTGPVTLDMDMADRHLLVVGNPGSGRSTLLAAVGHARADAELWSVDPRGSLHAAGIRGVRKGRSPAEIEALLADLHQELLATLNGSRPARRTLLLIDDLDTAMALTSPAGWTAIAALLPLAADLEFTLAVARRCAGMARAAYDPFLAAIREAGATGVLLDGASEEGPIVGGVRCRPSPPGRALLVRPGQPPRPVQLYAEPPRETRHASNL
jgi:S-DNA-T family DNA segregation ATPase FtsK/SpoIIIE